MKLYFVGCHFAKQQNVSSSIMGCLGLANFSEMFSSGYVQCRLRIEILWTVHLSVLETFSHSNYTRAGGPTDCRCRSRPKRANAPLAAFLLAFCKCVCMYILLLFGRNMKISSELYRIIVYFLIKNRRKNIVPWIFEFMWKCLCVCASPLV
jgi:hypothetical protein